MGRVGRLISQVGLGALVALMLLAAPAQAETRTRHLLGSFYAGHPLAVFKADLVTKDGVPNALRSIGYERLEAQCGPVGFGEFDGSIPGQLDLRPVGDGDYAFEDSGTTAEGGTWTINGVVREKRRVRGRLRTEFPSGPATCDSGETGFQARSRNILEGGFPPDPASKNEATLSVEARVREGVPVFLRGFRYENVRYRCEDYGGRSLGIASGPIPLTPAVRENGKKIYVFSGRFDGWLATVRLRGRVNADGTRVRGHMEFLGSHCPVVQDFFFAERLPAD